MVAHSSLPFNERFFVLFIEDTCTTAYVQ